MLPINICHVQTPEGMRAYVVISVVDKIFNQGLAPEEILGQLIESTCNGESESITPENFARNPAFVEFLHGVIKKHGPSIPGLVSAAEHQGAGWVYVIDNRTPTPNGNVSPEDIIGGFEVVKSRIYSESYRANPNHKILSSHGFFQLETKLEQKLLNELTKST